MAKEKISSHINYDESVHSQTASRLGIPNIPNETQLAKMKITAEKIFEPLRTIVSEKRKADSPIHVNSFFRSPELNKAIGGSATSSHCLGEAIDIDVDGLYTNFTNKNLFTAAKQLGAFDQLICEFGTDESPAWVHVSYRERNNRNQILKATKINGKTKYIPFA